jgi:molybdenum cofactor synthesis domain-containing protein
VRPIRETIPLETALELMLAEARPIERTERVTLNDAAGRVLASAPAAPADVPPFDRAAMDGYAVRAEDTFGASRDEPRRLRWIATVFTGQTTTRVVGPGECIEIATGAPMPPGADAVIMVEETDRHGDDVAVFTPVYPRQNVGRRGADIAAGQSVLQPGDLLTPAKVGVLAACGTSPVEVYAKPRVAILSTGNEIVEPGRQLGPAEIYDINRYTLAAIAAAHGGAPVALPSTGDSIDELSAAIDRALEHDVLVFSGGSSVGERDLILDAIRRRGEIVFHGIAVKPGKPTALGRVNGKPVIGMPGNPTSCLSNGYILLAPMLRRIARLPAHRPATLRVPLARRIVSTTGRHQFYTVRIENDAAVPAFKGSGDITSMALADGYIEIPAQVDLVEAGELVTVVLF